MADGTSFHSAIAFHPKTLPWPEVDVKFCHNWLCNGLPHACGSFRHNDVGLSDKETSCTTGGKHVSCRQRAFHAGCLILETLLRRGRRSGNAFCVSISNVLELYPLGFVESFQWWRFFEPQSNSQDENLFITSVNKDVMKNKRTSQEWNLRVRSDNEWRCLSESDVSSSSHASPEWRVR